MIDDLQIFFVNHLNSSIVHVGLHENVSLLIRIVGGSNENNEHFEINWYHNNHIFDDIENDFDEFERKTPIFQESISNRTSTLTLQNVSILDSGFYSVVVKNNEMICNASIYLSVTFVVDSLQKTSDTEKYYIDLLSIKPLLHVSFDFG